MSKVVFSSLFFFHRITVKPSPRQLDLGALLVDFLRTNERSAACAPFFFFFFFFTFRDVGSSPSLVQGAFFLFSSF